LAGGFRKVRLAIQSKGKGKSGGARIITYALLMKDDDSIVFLIIQLMLNHGLFYECRSPRWREFVIRASFL